MHLGVFTLAKKSRDINTEIRGQRLADAKAQFYWLVVKVKGQKWKKKSNLEFKSGVFKLIQD